MHHPYLVLKYFVRIRKTYPEKSKKLFLMGIGDPILFFASRFSSSTATRVAFLNFGRTFRKVVFTRERRVGFCEKDKRIKFFFPKIFFSRTEL